MKYLFAAYTIVWIVLFIYIFTLSRRVSEVKREIETFTARGEE